MVVSHIVPKGSLDLIKGRPFHMCLANIAIKDDEYANFYKNERELGSFILLDNGAAEKDQISKEEILTIIRKVNPNEVVLMDELCHMDETIFKTFDSMDFYRENGYEGQFMAVPQGDNLNEWKECLLKMNKMDKNNNINTIGVSKFLTSHYNDPTAREKAIDFIRDCGFNYDIHMLGCHINIQEVIDIGKKRKDIRSNDTAIAYIYEESGMSVLDGNRPSNEIDFVDGLVKNKTLLKTNMAIFDEGVKWNTEK